MNIEQHIKDALQQAIANISDMLLKKTYEREEELWREKVKSGGLFTEQNTVWSVITPGYNIVDSTATVLEDVPALPAPQERAE